MDANKPEPGTVLITLTEWDHYQDALDACRAARALGTLAQIETPYEVQQMLDNVLNRKVTA